MFITPEHDFLTKPLQMFWIDGRALKSIAGTDLYPPGEIDDGDDDETDPVLVRQIAAAGETTNTTTTAGGSEDGAAPAANGGSRFPYPLRPTVSAIIANLETTTHPVTHMGYAAGWFGLTGSCFWYVTRTLITRGRRR